MNKLLISITEIKEFQDIAANIVAAKRVDPWILQAQTFDIKPIIGDALLLELLTQVELVGSPAADTLTPDNEKLLNGCQYTYQGETFLHYGLKPVLVYFAFARFKRNNSSVSTSYGIVQKNDEFSTPVSEKTIAAEVEAANQAARAYQADFVLFMDRNYTLYPLWNTSTFDSKKYRSRWGEIGE